MLGFFNLSFYFVCCILMCLVTAKPLSILLIEPLLSKSHHVWTVNLIKGLLRKGHHVHVVSIQETKVDAKLAQNLTFAVSRRYKTRLHFKWHRLFAICNKSNKTKYNCSVLKSVVLYPSKQEWIKKIKNLNSAMTTRIYFYPIKI